MAESIDSLHIQADEMENSNLLTESAEIHKQVIIVDSSNYESNIWLGNYYFLQGQALVNAEDNKYNAIKYPSRMQIAFHMDELKNIYYNYFIKAEPYLIRAYDKSKNEYLHKLLESVDWFRVRIGLKTTQEKKVKKRLFIKY